MAERVYFEYKKDFGATKKGEVKRVRLSFANELAELGAGKIHKTRPARTAKKEDERAADRKVKPEKGAEDRETK